MLTIFIDRISASKMHICIKLLPHFMTIRLYKLTCVFINPYLNIDFYRLYVMKIYT